VDAYNNAAKDGATIVSLVSTAMQQVDTSLYRTIVLGGAKAPLHRPDNSVITYGLTESGSGVVYNGLPLDEVEIEIRDGVVFLRAPMLLRSYRDGATPPTTACYM
jgi:O-succinylbenzoic acid--CoA ligase